ncbi:MAG TPA: cupin domain-containing protein [Dysgonomonas sp.]|nr:cupin domain-containing protein [Dysgonomonas sp.]
MKTEKQIKVISKNKNHTAVDIGSLSDLRNYSYIHPINGKTVTGKVFLKEATDSTGTEVSVSRIPPNKEVGYFHIHTDDEETYIILKGSGYYQVDDDCFPIKEGSVVRVAPEGIRSFCNTSNEEMVYLCIQSKENSLEEYSTDDGQRVEHEKLWQ